MIDLTSIGYPNIEKIYLFDFTPGHGGDFFITLASKCSPEFVYAWQNTEQMQDRMQEFLETKQMPGNNIGGKLIYADSVSEYKQQILADLYRIGGSTATKMSFCTHPTGDNVNTRISDVLKHCFPRIPIQRVALTITSKISEYFTIYSYYNDDSEYTRLTLRRTQDPESRFIYWEDPKNTLLVDHMDLFINNPVQFKNSVQDIAGTVNWDWYNYIIEMYAETKVDPSLKWYNKNYGT